MFLSYKPKFHFSHVDRLPLIGRWHSSCADVANWILSRNDLSSRPRHIVAVVIAVVVAVVAGDCGCGGQQWYW